MVTLADLWLPILLSAVLVFVVSSVIHMALQLHKADYQKLPGEPEVLGAMRAQGVAPGHYVFPCAGSMKDMASPDMIAKFRQGPVGFLIVRPAGSPAIGKSLVQWFLFSIAISVVVAYAAKLALARGDAFGEVFRVSGTAAILGYAFGHIQDSIWKGLSWSISLKFAFDGVLYGLVTGLAFAWLWPSAATV